MKIIFKNYEDEKMKEKIYNILEEEIYIKFNFLFLSIQHLSLYILCYYNNLFLDLISKF